MHCLDTLILSESYDRVWSLGFRKNPPDRQKTDHKLQILFYGSYSSHFIEPHFSKLIVIIITNNGNSQLKNLD